MITVISFLIISSIMIIMRSIGDPSSMHNIIIMVIILCSSRTGWHDPPPLSLSLSLVLFSHALDYSQGFSSNHPNPD